MRGVAILGHREHPDRIGAQENFSRDFETGLSTRHDGSVTPTAARVKGISSDGSASRTGLFTEAEICQCRHRRAMLKGTGMKQRLNGLRPAALALGIFAAVTQSQIASA